jgi:hypothetical protein
MTSTFLIILWLVTWLQKLGIPFPLSSIPISAEAVAFDYDNDWKVTGELPTMDEYVVAAIEVSRGLSLIPKDVLEHCVTKIVITTALAAHQRTNDGSTGSEERCSGTYHNDVIFISSECAGSSARARAGMVVLHELSSVLLKKYPQHFDERYWKSLLPDGFQYTNDPSRTAKQKSQTTMEDLLMQGFVSPYSCTSMENDFNTITESLFSGNPILWMWYYSSPKLQTKIDYVIKFYTAVSPQLDVEYFKHLRHF